MTLHLAVPKPPVIYSKEGDQVTMRDITLEWSELRCFGGFNFIMADPPWAHIAWSPKGKAKSQEAHYDTQGFDWIERLPIDVLAGPDCLLWLWGTNNLIPRQLAVMESWGFDFVTSGHWSKHNPKTHKLAFGTGYILRNAGEPFFIGRRGDRNKLRCTRSVRSVVEAKRGQHSQKPEAAFRAAEAMMPGARRIELFSRTNRPGWTHWGNEVNTIPVEA